VHLHTERLGAGRPRLVLVHGFTQTGRSCSAVADDLARDHEVVLVDAPGHGGSSQACGDLPSSAHALGEAGGDAVYVGYSMGGRLCLQLALDEPQRVLGLVRLGARAGIVDDGERAARLAASLRVSGTGTQADLWGRVGALDMPVLVLSGELDAKFAAIGRDLAATIGEKARFETVARAGHAAHLEQPAAFVQILQGWLTEQGW
jgi:pimeloyl-ACP methyl ester carboxylesterase